jgi:thiamine pyrophosphate-dependent acetolactate synthase large subunit-like protein
MSSLFMGGITAFAFGLAVALPNRRIVALDSDGSLLLGVGVLCTLANELPPNLTVVVLDNECYEGTGRQPTHTSRRVDLARLAAGAGIPRTATADDPASLAEATRQMLEDDEVGLVVAKFEPGPPPAYAREQIVPWDDREGKYRFIRYLERTENISIKPIYVDE